MAPDFPAVLRIGELSRRLGVSAHVLRAWERRYGLLHPQRSASGYRLYSQADEDRVRRMQAHLARGLSAAEAARAALDEDQATPSDFLDHVDEGRVARPEGLAATAGALAQALDALDEPAAQAVLDRLLAEFTVETVLRDVVLPYLHELGERWQRGTVSVAQEHFASHLLRGRLASLARGWGHGHGPQALLACAPGELHDLPLLAFGIVLHRNGWRVRYLGADTPLAELTRMAADVRPDLVVLTVATPDRLDGLSEPLSRLARLAPLALAGGGATLIAAHAVGARLLTDDPVTAAERMPPPRSRWDSVSQRPGAEETLEIKADGSNA
jgi:DNA-binding transcriptional MerR regulator